MDGNQATDAAIFWSCLFCFGLYHVYYFTRGLLPASLSGRHIDLWTTAKRTRRAWAEDVMAKADDARAEGLLAVQTLRNVIVSASILVMGLSQVAGRLLQIMVTQSDLDTIAKLSANDPITGPSPGWTPSYVKVAVSLGANLLSLLSFGQCVRLAVHLGFCIRVKGVHGHTGHLALHQEIIVMTERCSLYFTLGLRFLYLFIAFVWWMLGTTALMVGTITVLALLILSDQINATYDDEDTSVAPEALLDGPNCKPAQVAPELAVG